MRHYTTKYLSIVIWIRKINSTKYTDSIKNMFFMFLCVFWTIKLSACFCVFICVYMCVCVCVCVCVCARDIYIHDGTDICGILQKLTQYYL